MACVGCPGAQALHHTMAMGWDFTISDCRREGVVHGRVWEPKLDLFCLFVCFNTPL